MEGVSHIRELFAYWSCCSMLRATQARSAEAAAAAVADAPNSGRRPVKSGTILFNKRAQVNSLTAEADRIYHSSPSLICADVVWIRLQQ
jgi:hypothetical protein